MNTCFTTCIPQKFLMNDKQLSHLLKFFPVKNKFGQPGRPPIEAKAVLQGIFYLLKTGCQWNALPQCFGPSSTIHENYQKLIKNDFFLQTWHHALEKYDRYVGLALREQSFDCAHTKAPLGGEATGCSPVDIKKLGTKRAMLTDRDGIPLAITIAAGNIHDSTTCISTIANLVYDREPAFKTIELDAAFDAASIKKDLEKMGYHYQISPNKRNQISPNKRRNSKLYEQPKHRFRWSVERTHSWINRFRRLLIRWDKKLDNFLDMIQFACQIIVSEKFNFRIGSK